MHYIYKITNTLNYKIYIGQSKNPFQRWSQHKYHSRKAEPLQIVNKAMKKYGVNNFTFEIIISCVSQENANLCEETCIKQYNSLINENGYNLIPGGLVFPKSDEHKKHMSKVMSGGAPSNKGKRMSEEQKQKISQAHIGKVQIKHSLETIQKMCASHKNRKPISEETRYKMSIAKKKGKPGRISWKKSK